jgi:hypothetical protein
MKRLVFLLLLVSCTPKKIPIGQIVGGPMWAYQRIDETTYRIAAADEHTLRQVLIEIGCGKKMVCSIESAGHYWIVEQTPTK